ncbi:Mitochondrial import receptor subunit Tom22 [Trinorchestia longiramus]|nr:Mitochondrial import receptor subunit Tom22 [Trinorchestia longiramus]
MANEAAPEVDSGVASPEETPVSKESIEIVPPSMEPEASGNGSSGSTASNVSKDKKEERVPVSKPSRAIEENDDDIDESLLERLVGLTEMFPDSLRNATCSLASYSLKLVASGYHLSRHLVWFTATTSLLLVGPVLFEVERINAEEMIKQDRNKLVLGTGTAMSGSPQPGLVPPAQ